MFLSEQMSSDASRKAAAALSPETRRLLADLWTGKSDSGSLVDWATNQLIAGRDSPALRILAGLGGEDSREVQDYFGKALAEMGIPFPNGSFNKHDCLVYYCADVAREVIKDSIPPLKACGLLWPITVELNYPDELRCWLQLESDLDIMEYQGAPVSERETAVRQACEHFLLLLDSFTETGIARLTLERSLSALRSRGLDAPASAADIPRRMPSPRDEDGDKGLSFFRTRVEREDFRDLTIPWSMFLRSEIIDCRFENTDLSESSMTWCDWTHCIFIRANLRGCDLRRSVFRRCYFYDAVLDNADLRGAQFEDCRFGDARMNGARLEKSLGLFAALRCRQLKLSREQASQVTWVSGAGSEPDGG